MPFLLVLSVVVSILISFCVKKALSLSKHNSITKNQENENYLTTKLFPIFTNPDEEIHVEHLNEVKSLMPYFISQNKPNQFGSHNIFNDDLVKKDPGGLGFLDEVGGSVDGLMSCTESLGFESSDERRVDDDLGDISKTREDFPTKISKRIVVRSEVKKYPPPLSSLNRNGKPSFFLRPMRRDGRLELAEVKIKQPEILRASREDGRLILHLIQELEEDSEDEGKEIIENFIEEKEDEKWLFPTTVGGGERFRRCHEAATCHYHHMHRVGSLVW